MNDGDVSVTIGGADVKIAGEEGNLIVDFPGDEAPDCAVPLNEAASVWLWGGDEIDEVTVETPGLMDVAGDFVPDAINGGPGIDVVAYSQYVNPVVVNVASPPIDEIPGELKGVVVLDVDDDGEHEVGMALPGSLELGLSPGDDKFSMTRQAVSLLEDQTTGPVLKVDGGAGTDAATIETLPSRPTFLGQDLEIMRTLGQSLVYGALVNFDGKSDETVDAAWAGFERFTMMGSSKNDTVLGTGGAGTGGSFAYPLTIIGKGGKDRLTGGAANDKLNGGPDRDVCNGGKGRDIASKCETTKNVP